MPKDLEATLQRINELQIAFIAKLGDRVKEISRLILQLDGSISAHAETNQQLLQTIEQRAHSLAGSAGTFKQTAIYNKAKAIELLSGELLDKNKACAVNHYWHKLLLEFVVGLRGDVNISGRPAIVEDFNHPPADTTKKTLEIADLQTDHYPVIVVDDDDLLVGLIKEQAKHFGYNIIPLLSTESLEKTIDQYQPVAILIDVVFPDAKHSGIEIINELKAKDKIQCPVIFMSNRCDVEVRLDALRAGSNAYIVKPLEILELIRILDRLTDKLNRRKSRILIVDDDPLITQFYQIALSEEGFICEVILNPLEIINKISSFVPDAILLDVNMPDCDGFEIAQIIRQDDDFTHIPLFFLTADNTSEQEIQAMKSGGDDFLNKNTDIVTLIEIIKGHVQRYKELDSVLTRLKRDEIRFRSVTSSSNDGIISVDAKGRIVFWNEGAENIFGYHALETIGQPIELIVPLKNKEKQSSGFKKLLEDSMTAVCKTLETCAIKKDGSLIDIELSYTEWISGSERLYTTIIRDISHRKQIEQQLQHKEASLNAIVTSSGEGIITIDDKGIIETVNPKAAQLFGYTVEELIGLNVSVLVPAPEKHRHDEYVINSELHAPRIIDHARELSGERKDGSTFFLELNVSPMQINGERKFVGILHDISERKQFINALLLAKGGAESANKAKNQFLSSMSHELRTPLNAILGFTQLLQADTDPPLTADQMESLSHIYDGGIHLLTLITQVLDLSKLEAGILQLKSESIALVEFTNEIVTQLKPLANKTNVSMSLLVIKNNIFINADKMKLRQVITNLLSNAIKYNKPDGNVYVFLTPLRDKVRLSVADTGKGIAAELMQDLFKPFCRLGAEASAIEGTGIGLTITKKLLEMMGGQIGVESKLNEGSTFWIELEATFI